jgi:hypothetical protein
MHIHNIMYMRQQRETRTVSPEREKGEKPRDVTRFLGENTMKVLKRVFDTMPSRTGIRTKAEALEWAQAVGIALKGGIEKFAGSAFKLPRASADRNLLLNGLSEPLLAGALALGVIAAADPGRAETLKKNLDRDTRTQHELIVKMKNDPSVRQFIPERKPHEAILYNVDELYPQLKEWKTKHPNVKGIEISEFRAAVKHTHDDKRHKHDTVGEVTITARVYLKDGSKKTITVTGVGHGLPESLNYYAMEMSQRFGDAIGATSVPDVHKQKSPFYEQYGDNDAPGFAWHVRFAKQDAIKKLFKELDVVSGESAKAK